MTINDFLKNIFQFGHPIQISLLIAVIVCILCYFFLKHILIPLRKRHKLELEFNKAKLMALFAEADPNPLMRVDKTGKIFGNNEEAKKLFPANNIVGESLFTLIDENTFDLLQIIAKDQVYICGKKLNERYYSVYIKGLSALDIALVYMHDITFRYKYEENMRNFYDKLQDNIELEKKRISFELHDDIGQNLTLAKLFISNGKPIDTIIALLDKTHNDLRGIAKNLRPRILEEEGIQSALKLLCNTISSETGIEGVFTAQCMDGRLDEKKELLLYRLAQESLNNIVKHSKARCFNVLLNCDGELVKLNISDDGVGIQNIEELKNNHFSSGLGLFNMKERAELLGGHFEIDSLPGRGTKLFFEIPRN